jgi:hypothetical protein
MAHQISLLPNTALTVMSEQELVTEEDIIRKGKDAFIDVGNALARVRDGRGYTMRGYKTFEAYCDAVWGFSDRHARRLMEGAETSQTIKEITGETPANEAVAREFSRIAKDRKTVERVAAKLKTHGGVGKATAEKVAAAVASVTHKAAPASNGTPKPKPELAPAPPSTFTDQCPHCGMTPTTYARGEDGWHCGACEGAVFIGVVSAARQNICKRCSKTVAPNAPICTNCGEIQ